MVKRSLVGRESGMEPSDAGRERAARGAVPGVRGRRRRRGSPRPTSRSASRGVHGAARRIPGWRGRLETPPQRPLSCRDPDAAVSAGVDQLRGITACQRPAPLKSAPQAAAPTEGAQDQVDRLPSPSVGPFQASARCPLSSSGTPCTVGEAGIPTVHRTPSSRAPALLATLTHGFLPPPLPFIVLGR